MRRNVLLVLSASLFLAITMLAAIPAIGAGGDYALGIWVNEVGTTEWEAVVMGFSWQPQVHSWELNFNKNSFVHIKLDGGLTTELRRHEDSTNDIFHASISCEDHSRDYLVRYGFISASSTGGPWSVPAHEPIMTLTQSAFGTSNSFAIARELGSNDLNMGGNFDITVDFQNPQPVPEPGSMVAMFSGLVGLAGYGIKRKK